MTHLFIFLGSRFGFLVEAGQPCFNIEMGKRSSPKFEKTAACPTNEVLLAFLREEPVTVARLIGLREHLAGCEFCELSLDLLRAHPAEFDPIAPEAPPVPKRVQYLFRKKRIIV